MPNTLPQTSIPRELFTRERRRTRMQDFLLRFEGKTEQRPTATGIFQSTKTLSPASQTRTVATLSR
jgi:hypothetical protein